MCSLTRDGRTADEFCGFVVKKKFAILAQMKNDIKLTYKHTHKAKCKRTLHKAQLESHQVTKQNIHIET